jgi:hypothetical protein
MYIRAYSLIFLQKKPLSYTTSSILLKAHLQAFVVVALGREAIISMIFIIIEASEFCLASLTSKIQKTPKLSNGLGSNFVKDHAIH